MSRPSDAEVIVELSKVMRNLCGPPQGGKPQVDHKVWLLWTKRSKGRLVRCDAMAEAQVSVAVLGAAGTIAPAIVHDLGVSDEVESMILLDLDPDKAAAVADEHGHGKAAAARVDARDVDALAGAARGRRRRRAAEHRLLPDQSRRDAGVPAGGLPLPRPGWPVLRHGRAARPPLGVRAVRAAGRARDRVEPWQDEPHGRGGRATSWARLPRGSTQSTSSPPAAIQRRPPTASFALRTRSRR